MASWRRFLHRSAISAFLIATTGIGSAIDFPSSERSESAIAAVAPRLSKELSAAGLRFGAPIFLRIFKDPGTLEVWVETGDGSFELFRSYEICSFSGTLGPKLKEGDNQSPEGFYFVTPSRLNPWSAYHLSFDLGFPNAYDRFHGRTGSALMVHGDCVSIGCYAMTDAYIDEIYALAATALSNGQPFFRVHVFPFRLDPENLQVREQNRWHPFWLNLKQGYDYFERHRKPPNVETAGGRYVFGP